jgi:prepilin-type N-terminal cleavage/methylation domain-containing protein
VKNQAGYTLPELLLVLFMGTVGLFILLCVIALFKFLLQFIFS